MRGRRERPPERAWMEGTIVFDADDRALLRSASRHLPTGSPQDLADAESRGQLVRPPSPERWNDLVCDAAAQEEFAVVMPCRGWRERILAHYQESCCISSARGLPSRTITRSSLTLRDPARQHAILRGWRGSTWPVEIAKPPPCAPPSFHFLGFSPIVSVH